MQSIFRYPGGKTKPAVCQWIKAYMPSEVREYREPFVGGGGVFFSLSPRKFPARWVNDRHPGLVAVYEALRDRPAEFIAACRAVEPARPDDPVTAAGKKGGKPINARLKKVFDRVAFDEGCDQAFRYFFVNRTVYAGRVNYDIPSRLYFSNPEGWNIVGDDTLERSADRLAGVRVTCGDYRPVFEEPGDGVWIYADPPYVVNTGMSRSSQLYQHGFTDDDHRELAEVIRRCRHKVALSYDDTPFIRALYPEADGFHLVSTSWAYVGTSNAVKADGKELLVLNYEPPGRLFVVAADGLSPAERTELEELEAVVDRGRKAFVEVGLALCAIRDRRLYREKHKTFEGYCVARWGMTRDYGDKLARSAQAVSSLQTIVCQLPEAESQARELIRLRDEDQQVAVWQTVVTRAEKENVPITARLVREEVGRVLPPKAESPPDWRRALERAWNLIPDEVRGEAWKFLNALRKGSAS